MHSVYLFLSHRRLPAVRCQRGVSLHDTLVTLAVVGTLTTLAVPGFQALLANLRVTTAANTLVTALYTARSTAITRGERAVLCPSSDGETCAEHSVWDAGYLLYVDLNANRAHDADEPVLRQFDAAPNLSIRSSVQRDHVSYLPSGLASGSNLSFALCSRNGGSDGRAVVVSNSGRARVANRLPSGSAPCPST
jgi:type IV fimbrial biogenesis protein FimT